MGNIIPFTPTNIPAGCWVSEDQCLVGSPAFAQPGGLGSSYNVRLVADGVHEPTFPNMSPGNIGSSYSFNSTLLTNTGTWLNPAGSLNQVLLWYGLAGGEITQFYNIANNSSLPVVPCFLSAALTHGSNPSLVISTGGSALNPKFVPELSRFAVTRSPGTPAPLRTAPTCGLIVSAVSVASSSITLSLSGTVSASDIVTLTYQCIADGCGVQDASGNSLCWITNAPVTVN
jgi:hypothetical protein